jgi:hypothetical protein
VTPYVTFTAQPVRGFGSRTVSFRSRSDHGITAYARRERFVYIVTCRVDGDESLRLLDTHGAVHWTSSAVERGRGIGSWTLGGFAGGLILELVRSPVAALRFTRVRTPAAALDDAPPMPADARRTHRPRSRSSRSAALTA